MYTICDVTGYMTVALNGVTDGEMEDLLSLEDEVLQDTYLYHLPPDPRLVRVPPLIWARLKYVLCTCLFRLTRSLLL